MKLSLAVKFNVVFLAVFIVGFIATSLSTHYMLQQSARRETLETARMLMRSASAASNNTAEQIVPLLENRLKFQFLPQSVPDFAAISHLQELLKSYPDYAYKEATLNPTNPRDLANDWEKNLISTLRSTGLSPGMLQMWLGSWALSWVVAFPTLLLVLPLVRRATAAIVDLR